MKPPLGRRPALAAAAVLVLLLAAALVGPVAADIEISDSDLPYTTSFGSEFEERTTSYDFSKLSPLSDTVSLRWRIFFPDITEFSEICYVVCDFPPGTAELSDSAWCFDSNGHYESRHTYAIASQPRQPVTVSVDRFQNAPGAPFGYRVTLWFDSWDIGTLRGPQDVCVFYADTDNLLLSLGNARYVVNHPLGDAPCVRCLDPRNYRDNPYAARVLVVGGHRSWHNTISVSKSQFYNVTLDRSGGPSTITLLDHGDALLSDFRAASRTYEAVTWDQIQVTNPQGDVYSIRYSSPAAPSKFSLSINPQTAPIGEPVTATLTAAAGAPAYDEIAWVHGDEQRTYMHNSTGWWEFSYSSYEYDAPSTEQAAHNYQFTTDSPPGLDPPQDQVRCLVYANGKLLQELIGRVPLAENVAKTQLAVVVIDYSGGDTPILSGATVTVMDEISKVSIPAASVDSTFSRFNVERGRRYIVTASAPGFVTGTRTVSAAGEIQTVEMYLSRDAAVVIPENSTLVQVDFLVKDTQNKHVEGALIALTDSQTSKTLTGLTNQFGTRTYLVEKDHLQQYTISKDGYVGVRGTLDPSIPGTRVVVLSKESDWGPGTTPGSGTNGTAPDHHAMVDQTLQDAYELVPSIFMFALLMLFLSIARRW